MRSFWDRQAAAVRVLGPAAAPIAKLRGRFRFHVLLQASEKLVLQEAIRHVQRTIQVPKDIQWLADVDPLDMM